MNTARINNRVVLIHVGTRSGWEGLSEGEVGEVGTYVKRSCKERSWAITDRKWGLWEEYMETRTMSGVLGLDLQGAASDAVRLARIVHFASWLNSEKGMRGKALTSALGAVRTQFEGMGVQTGWWDDSRMDRVRVAARPTTEEAKEDRAKSKGTMKLPISEEMVIACRMEMWQEGKYDKGALDGIARWLAVALGFDSGPRVGQLAKKEKNGEDHAVRAGHFTFVFQGGSSMVAGLDLRNKLKGLKGDYSSIALVDMEYVTDKVSSSRYVVDIKTIARRSRIESQVVDDLCHWVVYSGVLEEDEFLARYDPKTGRRKVITRSEITKTVKMLARMYGLPEALFSSKSLRKGFATQSAATAVNSDELKQRGGWSKTSRVPEKHYISRVGSAGGLAQAGNGQGLSVAEMKRLVGTRK